MTYEEICQEEYNKIDFNRSCAGVAIQNAIERIGINDGVFSDLQ